MRDVGGIDGRRPHVSSPRNYTNARRGIACGWFHFVLREFAYVQGRRAYLPARIGPPMCCPQLWPRRVNANGGPCVRKAKLRCGFLWRRMHIQEAMGYRKLRLTLSITSKYKSPHMSENVKTYFWIRKTGCLWEFMYLFVEFICDRNIFDWKI